MKLRRIAVTNMITYENLVATLKALFPEITSTEGYIPENESLPYAFVADLLDHLRKESSRGKIAINDPRIERLFLIITELGKLPKEQEKEIVASGFFESMLFGEPTDRFFIDAAKMYLNDEMWRLFRIVQTQHIGDPAKFVDDDVVISRNRDMWKRARAEIGAS